MVALFVAFALVLTPFASAVKHVDSDYYTRETRKPWHTKLIESFSTLTMVGGKLCSTYPDVEETCDQYTCQANCPNDISGGCVVEVYEDGSTSYDRHEEIEPGTSIWVDDGDLYTIYYCEEDCSCSDYESVGCGEGPCDNDEMLRERTCEESCAEEQVCVEWGCEGSTDSDGDGIIDSEDDCPYEYAETDDGCPEDSEEDSDDEECQSYSEKRCYDNDVYWYDSCGNRENKYEECGEDSSGTWSKYCEGDNLMRRRDYTERGCSDGSCYSETKTEEEKIKVCDNECEDGSCTNPSSWESFIIWIKSLFYR